jgi:predicted nuclease of predicted toxin-antitoxin system
MDEATLKFYTDKHVPKAVVVQLHNRGVDIVRCEDVGYSKAEDEDHLVYATEQGRAVVTRDTDFLRIHGEWMTSGKQHHGIFFLQDHLQGENTIGVIVTQLVTYYELTRGDRVTLEREISNLTKSHYTNVLNVSDVFVGARCIAPLRETQRTRMRVEQISNLTLAR